MNATTLINVGLGLCSFIVLFTSNFITFCAAAEVSRGSDGNLGDVMGGGDDWVDGDEEEREREWMNEMREMLQRADESRETGELIIRNYSTNKRYQNAVKKQTKLANFDYDEKVQFYFQKHKFCQQCVFLIYQDIFTLLS